MESQLQSTSKIIDSESFLTYKSISRQMNQFVSNSVVIKYSQSVSRARQVIYQKKQKKKMPTEPYANFSQIYYEKTQDLRQDTLLKSKSFLQNKMDKIQTKSLSKYNQIYKNESKFSQNILDNQRNITDYQKSRQNLAKSILKKFSFRISSDRNIQSPVSSPRFKSRGSSIILYPMGSDILSKSKQSEQRIKKFFNAYQKTQNQRVLRLVQRQRQNQERFCCIKNSIHKKMQKNAARRFSKRDAYNFSNPQSHSMQLKQSSLNLLGKSKNLQISKRQKTMA